MREGLAAASEQSPNALQGYDKGSTVLCQNCFAPLYRLERGLYPGQRTANTGRDYRPLTADDIEQLRREVPSIGAAMKLWTSEQIKEYVRQIPQFDNGMAPTCVFCNHSFPQIVAPTASEVNERAYTWILVTIPPFSDAYPIRSSHVDI